MSGGGTVKARIGKWPSNALRHSCASYYLAYHQKAAALALQMGHTSQAMIFSNYREVVTRQDAERFGTSSLLELRQT